MYLPIHVSVIKENYKLFISSVDIMNTIQLVFLKLFCFTNATVITACLTVRWLDVYVAMLHMDSRWQCVPVSSLIPRAAL